VTRPYAGATVPRYAGAPARLMLLALDTATDFPSLALGTAEAPGEDLRLPDRRDLSRHIERAVAGLLAARGAGPRDLAGVCVADGPGSFTGLRIGAAFAKGLCRALGVPLLAAPSLVGAAVRAARGSGAGLPLDVVVRYDALRGEWYRAVYRVAAAGIQVLVPPGLSAATQGDDASVPGAIVATERDASASALLSCAGRPGGPAAVGRPGAWEPAYGRLAAAEARRLAPS
jgi:tRNA threonylcarbamoyl adenosine modification protein YeaZ